MYVSNSELRARARETLGTQIFDKKWLYAIASAVIVSAILSAVSGMSFGIGTMLLTGPLYVGFHKLFLSLVRRGDEAKIGETFEGCYDFGSNLVLGIMHSLIISLWSLLFIIPGIVKAYSYSLVYFIKADHPEYDWRKCLSESERLMSGNRWNLFCLHLSFIGWHLLGGIVCCGIGAMWSGAYQSTATAHFYEELKKQDEPYTFEPFAGDPT